MLKPTFTVRQGPAIPDTAPDPWAAWVGACKVWNSAARDGLGLWFASCRAWSDVLTDLSRATGPGAILDVQSKWLAEGFDLCSQATAERLRQAGVTAPLLNDA